MIKQTLTCFSILLCTGMAYGQPQKGRTLLGGNIGGGTTTTKSSYYVLSSSTPRISENKTFNFNIGPSLDYFISDKASIGINLSYGRVKTTSRDLPVDSTIFERRSNSYRLSLNHTRYFAIKGPLYLGIRNGVYGALTSHKEPDNFNRKDYKESMAYMGYSLNLGLNYFVSDRLVLHTYVNILDAYYYSSRSGYKVREYDPSGNQVFKERNNKSQSFNLTGINTFNPTNITIGIQYYLGKKSSTEEIK